MDKDSIKKLTKPFSKDDVKPAPKGKFGSYVPHHLVTKRLNEHAYGQWSHICKEVIRNYKGEVRGVVTTFTLFGVSHDEIGDVDTNDVKNNNTEGELLKLCMSDALKRGAMRHGIGLHLWTGETTEEEHYANKTSELKPKQEKSKKEVAKITNDSAEKFAEDIGAKKKSVGDQLNDILKEMIPNKNKMQEIKTKVYNDMTKNTEVNEDVNNWTKKDMDKFLNRVEVALEDEDLVDIVIGAELKGEDMTDIPSGAWEQEPPTDKQLKTFNDKVAQATDDGQTELVKKAKDFLASGKATKKNIFDWIDTEGDWTLKDGS